MEHKDILYTVIIYRDAQKIEIYDKENNLIFDKYYEDESQMYMLIVLKTRACNDIDKINIIYK